MNILFRYFLFFFLLQGSMMALSNASLFQSPKNIKLLLCLMPGYSLQDAQQNLDYITDKIETIDYSSFLIDIESSYQIIFEIFNVMVYNTHAKNKHILENKITNNLIVDETNFILYTLERNAEKCNASDFYSLILSSLQLILFRHTHVLGLAEAVAKLQEELNNSVASSAPQSLNNLDLFNEYTPFFNDYQMLIRKHGLKRSLTPIVTL